ncbi:MAG: hypothetical protein QXR48_01100 [Candidatus Woesearchaeota archaeon]
MAEAKVRGWVYVVAALVAGYFGWQGNLQWAVYVLALCMLFSGYHHLTTKEKHS